MLAPTSTRPEEREFVVDSGASMHTMSKKELSSEEMDPVERSRTPAVVLTFNGEVHTHEEAQVSVHDLTLFVTVQLLVETPAVLSPGKLCEDHGYSCEWVSGRKPRLTKDGRGIVCKTDNFVPLVVPGFSANSGSVSSSTSPSQDSLRREVEPAAGDSMQRASSSYSGSVSERSGEMAPGNWCDLPKNPKPKKGRWQENSDDPVADLLERLEEFKENLVDTELSASAHSSHDSDLEHPTKVATKSRKQRIFTHFPKDRDCDECLRTKNNKGSLQKTQWRSSSSCRKVGWLDNGWSQSP